MTYAISQRHNWCTIANKKLFSEPSGKGFSFQIWNSHKLPSKYGHLTRQFLQNTITMVWFL